MTMPVTRVRKLLSYEGIPFPCLPTIEELNKKLSQNIIESLQYNPVTQPKEYDVEAAEILNSEKIYIGIASF